MTDAQIIRFAKQKDKQAKTKKAKKRIPFKRSKPRKRKTVIRLDAAGMKALREERYAMDKGKCVECGAGRPLNGDVFSRMHLAHLKSRGAGGSDTIENTRSKCFHCHIEVEHAGGKPCPPKQ